MADGGTTPIKLSILKLSGIVQDGDPCVYDIPMTQTVRDEDTGIAKLEFGRNHGYKANKVMMMVGETGSGKTTLINALVNYAFGVEWNDPFRFKMIVEDSHANQALSQTKNVTSYTLHHQDDFRMPYSLTIIDTPGFGDTEGIERDKDIVGQLRKFFTLGGDLGMSHIDVIGFVVQAPQARLSIAQRYVFDSTLALFGKDIIDNIFLLVTFGDGQEPEVLSAVREAEMPYKGYFLFNNCSLYPKSRISSSFFWDMGYESFQTFLEKFHEVESKSLTLTKEVLEERKRTEVYLDGLTKEIEVGLSKQNILDAEKEMLKIHEHDVDQNKNFSREVEDTVFVKMDKDTKGKHYKRMLNCKTCERTCCPWCSSYSWGFGVKMCFAMDSENMCTVCPSHCPLAEHEICDYMYYCSKKKVQITVDEIRLRYEAANERKLSAQKLIDEIQREYDLGQEKILEMTDSVRKSLERLREIALRPDPLNNVEYIKMMITNEKSTKKPGWHERINQLNKLIKRAEQLMNVK